LTKRIQIMLIVIVVTALIGGGIFAVSGLMGRVMQAQDPQNPETFIVRSPIVVTTRDLSLGDRITESDVEQTNIPVELAPRTAIEDPVDVIGKIVKTDLVQGEMILSHNLADPTNNIDDISFVLDENHVLLAFPADDLMSQESMISRGDIIDIFASFEQEILSIGEAIDETTGEAVTAEYRTFTADSMQKVGITAMVIEIISDGESQPLTGNNEENPSRKNTNIRAYMLALDPQDALILKHLKDIDAIFDLVLRNPTSTVEFDLPVISEDFIIEYYGLEILP